MKSCKVFVVILAFLLCACSQPLTVTKQENIIPVKQAQVFDITIIEGITAKKGIIDVLGTPSTITKEYLMYNYGSRDEDDNKILKMKLTQRDKTQYNIVLGDKKGKSGFILIFLDQKSNYTIVDYVSIS